MLALLLVAPAAFAEDREQRVKRAEALHRMALERIARNTFEDRRHAAQYLEDAVSLDPGNPTFELTLGRLYLSMGHVRLAREHFEKVARLEPEDAGARLGLGLVWRRDWLKFLDRTSLDRAASHLIDAVKLDPQLTEAWIALTPLLVEQGELQAASLAAVRAGESDPASFQPVLAQAYTSYRLGEVGRADTLFARAMPRLPRNVKERFDDIAPVSSPRDTFTLHRLADWEKPRFITQFWKKNDPDLSTPENEAQLEYWSRVSHAFFLFYDTRRREWDERGEVYVRYGPPAELDYNPLDMRLSVQFSTGPGYPTNILVWNYPELGMKVILHDRTLNEFYSLPVSMEQDMDPVPDMAKVDSLGDRVWSGGGRGVFHALPPGVRPRPVESLFAHFQGAGGSRALGALATPGTPGDSMIATFVVLDSVGREVARQRRPVSSSECEPNLQVADFAADLKPGSYTLGLSVRDNANRRGVARSDFTVEPPRAKLELSDLVLTCGRPDPTATPAMAGLAPNVAARVGAADPLTAYFEIYGLALGAGGQSRFQYEYVVRSAEKDRRNWFQRVLAPKPGQTPIAATREEQNAGNLRRQYVIVPIDNLIAGRYRLEVRVVDLLSGEEARSAAEFDRAAAAP